MAKRQSAALDRKKLMADPIMVTTIVVLITFLTLFILYPLAILLVDSFVGDGNGFTLDIFKRIFRMPTFTHAITNTLKVGFVVGILSSLVGLLFAYVEVYVKMNKFAGGLFKVVSMLPVVSPPFVLSLSMIMLFGKAGIITRFLLGIYDNSVYGYWGIVIVQTLTFFPVCYMMLKGLLKNIDPSLEEAARDMGASRFKVFTSVTLPLMLPGLGNAFLVTFIESIADFANPMIIGGSYDTLATTIYLQITGAYDKPGAAAMAVPGTVLGVGYIRGFASGVFHTGFLQGIYGTGLILIIVFVVRSLPTGTRSGISALRQIDKSIEESAYDMGADSFKVFMTVTLPLIKDSFLSGLVTAFVRSITAISAIILLVTPQFLLITVQINEFAEKGSYSLACAFATILIVITYGAVLLMDLFIKHFGTSKKIKEEA